MKTNKISKVNEKIYSLVDRLNELSDYNPNDDFDTRERMICANIKVYDWLDEYDVLKVCKDLGIKKTKKVLKEFNEERLNSVYNHFCESEVSYLKEKYEGNCDVSDFEKIFRVGRYAFDSINKGENYNKESYTNPKLKYYIENYWDKALTFKTFDDFKNDVITSSGKEYEDWYKRSLIDKIEVWQYGRSGGWLSICNQDELEFDSLVEYELSWQCIDGLKDAYNSDDNYAFNQALLIDDWTAKDKPKLIKTLEGIIQTAEEKTDAVRYIIDQIEGSKKYFKECLLSQLEHEINEFITEYNDYNVQIKIVDDTIKTTLGVSVPLQEFKDAFSLVAPHIEKLQRKEKFTINKIVGKYKVEYAKRKKDDILIKAGCHRFSYNQIKQVIL